MTKKEFVLDVVNQLSTDAKSVLSGHRLSAGILSIIQQRADIQSKLAGNLLSMKTRSQGSKGLRKAQNFQIKGYASFGQFNMEARKDIEAFMQQLAPEDQQEFTNKSNISVIVALPDENIMVDDKEQIATGPSVIVPFDKAIRSEQKTIGGAYIMIMFGKSAITTEAYKSPKVKRSASEVSEQKALLAEKRAKKKERIAARREKEAGIKSRKAERLAKARIRGEEDRLNTRFARDMSGVNRQAARLAGEQQVLAGEVSQIDKLIDRFGPNIGRGIKSVDKTYDKFITDLKRFEPIISKKDKAIMRSYFSLMNRGKESEAKSVLKGMENRQLAVMLWKQLPESSIRILEREKAPLYAQLEKLRNSIPELMTTLESDDPKAQARAKSRLAVVNQKIRVIRAKLGTYKEMSSKAITTKTKMLSETRSSIEANIARGESLKSALQSALGALRVTPAEKEVIKQEVVSQIQQGVPAVYAMQQAIQNNVSETPTPRRGRRTKATSVAELIADGVL